MNQHAIPAHDDAAILTQDVRQHPYGAAVGLPGWKTGSTDKNSPVAVS
jgi:hypothetical protein